MEEKQKAEQQQQLRLTRIILSFAFASYAELGWDPTVTMVSKQAPRTYEISIGENTYTTTIKELRVGEAYALPVCGTRVFLVREQNNPDKMAIMKDMWIDKSSSKTERQIYDGITQYVENKLSEDEAKLVKHHLMTPIHDGFVMIGEDLDDTGELMMHKSDVDVEGDIPWLITQAKRMVFGPMEPLVYKPDYIEKIPVQHKKHYRVVYEEEASPRPYS